MFYEFTRAELKEKCGCDFKQGDMIDIEGRYTIFISYKGNNITTGEEIKFSIPSLCSKVMINSTGKYQDVVFRPSYIENFLHRKPVKTGEGE